MYLHHLALLLTAFYTLQLTIAGDPCAAIAGKQFVCPSKALACQKYFAFNETLRQNVLTNVARVMDLYTFEDYYLESPSPFQDSTVNIREQLARINETSYATDYDFNRDLYLFTNRLNDGHTCWFPSCYLTYQSIIPAPIVALEFNGSQSIFIAPDSVDLLSALGSNFTDYFDELNFDWKRLAGALVLSIQGRDPWTYVSDLAEDISGTYLDHDLRINSVFSSYRISQSQYSQRIGDFAGQLNAEHDSVAMQVVLVNSSEPIDVDVPILAASIGREFKDAQSYWQANCAANNLTNGVDRKEMPAGSMPLRILAQAKTFDISQRKAVALPPQYQPKLPPVTGGTDGVIKSYILTGSGRSTGVMFVGSFADDFDKFMAATAAAVSAFKDAGVTHLLIDLTNNGGGYICLASFLFSYLAGSQFGYAGFDSTLRASPLARKILEGDIALGLNASYSFYTADNAVLANGTALPASYNYLTDPTPQTINKQHDFISPRIHDICDTAYSQPLPNNPPFELKNIAIVSNGDCASSCALFSTLMYERFRTKIAVFGGNPTMEMQYKGMAGNQVLEWSDIDSEIKTAGIKDDPLSPPDLLVDGNFRHNWRTAWSYIDARRPIAYQSEQPQYRFPYTIDTYNNPQKLWEFASEALFD